MGFASAKGNKSQYQTLLVHTRNLGGKRVAFWLTKTASERRLIKMAVTCLLWLLKATVGGGGLLYFIICKERSYDLYA